MFGQVIATLHSKRGNKIVLSMVGKKHNQFLQIPLQNIKILLKKLSGMVKNIAASRYGTAIRLVPD